MPMSAAEAETEIRAGVAALRARDAATARRHFEAVIERGSPLPPPWFALAQACLHGGDHAAEEAALDKFLAMEPRNLGALIMKGDCRWRADDKRAASSFYQLALAVAAQAREVPPVLAGELRRVEALSKAASAEFQRHLEGRLPAVEGGSRVAQAVDIMLGRKRVYLQEPNSFYFPGLPQTQFYEREDFPWLSEIEAAAPAIRSELEAALTEDEGFRPYVEANPDRPLPNNHLLGDPSWSAFYLWKSGAPAPGNAERCPRTMEALAKAPMPAIRGRSPVALFSLLRPGTHIAPHNGLLNTRLICHLPLIVPPGCRLRVGNEIREWEPGKALIFDDSIEHEAWNEGSETRVVLIFEIWRPEIGPDERTALTAMFEAITDYEGEPQDF